MRYLPSLFKGGLFDVLILTKFYNPIVRKDFFPIYFSLNIHLKLHRCKTKFKLDQELTGGFCIENYLTLLL